MLPIVIAVAVFPLAFLLRSVRTKRSGFLFPLSLSALFVVAAMATPGPAYPEALFAVLGAGFAWRWYIAARTPA